MSVTMDIDGNFVGQDIDEDIKKEVLDFLRTKPVSDVKDYLLEVNHNLSTTDEKFNNQLKLHYSVILRVIQNIAVLHSDLSDVDTEFRELCFNDNLYQIRKLPTFRPVSLPADHDPFESNNNDLQNVTLGITNWILAVTTFINRFANSNENGNSFFEEMITHTLKLGDNKDDSKFIRYKYIIKKKALSLQTYIVDSLIAHTITLNLEQSISLFNLFHFTIPFFSWDLLLTEQYNNLLYDMILEDYDIESFYGDKNIINIKSPSVKDFLQSSLFKSNVIQRLIDNIEDQLTQLENTGNNNNTSVIEETPKTEKQNKENDDEYEDEDDMDNEISTIVNNSLMQAMGLIYDNDINEYNNIEQIMDQLNNLKDLKADSIRVQTLKERLLAYLQAKQNQLSKNGIVMQPQNTDETVQTILHNYNMVNLEDLISQQIAKLHNTATG